MQLSWTNCQLSWNTW